MELTKEELEGLYEVFAQAAVEQFNEKADIEGWILQPILGVVANVQEPPKILPAHMFYRSAHGKDALAAVIKVMLDSPSVAAVFQISEIWYANRDDGPTPGESLADAPDRQEGIGIFVHTRGRMRHGRCPIEQTPKGRRARFEPLLPEAHITLGRFSPFERETDPTGTKH